MKRAHFLGLTLLPLALACGEDTGLTDEDYDDMAVAVAALTADAGGDMEALEDAAGAIAGQIPRGWTQSSTGSYEGQYGGVEYRYDIECRNSRGQVLAACDLRTRSADVDVRIEGAWNSPRRTGDFLRVGDWALTWDGGDRVQVNGSIDTDLNTQFAALQRNDERTYVMATSADVDAVQVDLASGRLVSGKLTYTVAAERTRTTDFADVEASFDLTVEVEFTPNGPIVLTFAPDRQYEVNRQTMEITRRSSSR